jgi:hypothetical protein
MSEGLTGSLPCLDLRKSALADQKRGMHGF